MKCLKLVSTFCAWYRAMIDVKQYVSEVLVKHKIGVEEDDFLLGIWLSAQIVTINLVCFVVEWTLKVCASSDYQIFKDCPQKASKVIVRYHWNTVEGPPTIFIKNMNVLLFAIMTPVCVIGCV